MLKNIFTELVKKYTSDNALVDSLWNEIEQHYSADGRYYHAISHLDNLFQRLSEVKNTVDDFDDFRRFAVLIVANADVRSQIERKRNQTLFLRFQYLG